MSDGFMDRDWIGGVGGLPDPDSDAQFYDGVPVRRLVAFLIDAAIIWLAAAVFVVLTLGLGLLALGLVPIADFIYRVLSLSARSQTFGMRLMRIELRRRNGDRFDAGAAIVHTAGFYLASLSVLAQLISVFLMAGSSMGRGLHDLPLGSTMINSPE